MDLDKVIAIAARIKEQEKYIAQLKENLVMELTGSKAQIEVADQFFKKENRANEALIKLAELRADRENKQIPKQDKNKKFISWLSKQSHKSRLSGDIFREWLSNNTGRNFTGLEVFNHLKENGKKVTKNSVNTLIRRAAIKSNGTLTRSIRGIYFYYPMKNQSGAI